MILALFVLIQLASFIILGVVAPMVPRDWQ